MAALLSWVRVGLIVSRKIQSETVPAMPHDGVNRRNGVGLTLVLLLPNAAFSRYTQSFEIKRLWPNQSVTTSELVTARNGENANNINDVPLCRQRGGY